MAFSAPCVEQREIKCRPTFRINAGKGKAQQNEAPRSKSLVCLKYWSTLRVKRDLKPPQDDHNAIIYGFGAEKTSIQQ